MAVQRVLTRWRGLKDEAKIAIIVAIFTALVGPLVVFILTRPQTTEQLEFSKLEVNGSDPEQGRPQALDITVRNSGETVSVITHVELTIRAFERFSTCETTGRSESSYVYGDVELPLTPRPGQTIRADLRQQVPKDESDTFTLQITVPEGDEPRTSRLYLLDVALFHDGAAVGVSAGAALVAVPFEPTTDMVESCGVTAWERLRAMLDREGVARSASLSLPARPPEDPLDLPSDPPEIPLGVFAEYEAMLEQGGLSCDAPDPGNLECIDSGGGSFAEFFLSDDSTTVTSVYLQFDGPSEELPDLFPEVAGLALGRVGESRVRLAATEVASGQVVEDFGHVAMSLEYSRGSWQMHID